MRLLVKTSVNSSNTECTKRPGLDGLRAKKKIFRLGILVKQSGTVVLSSDSGSIEEERHDFVK